jgi:hypothetical protein
VIKRSLRGAAADADTDAHPHSPREAPPPGALFPRRQHHHGSDLGGDGATAGIDGGGDDWDTLGAAAVA